MQYLVTVQEKGRGSTITVFDSLRRAEEHYKEAMESQYAEQWKAAMDEEMKNLFEFGCFEKVTRKAINQFDL